MSSSLDEQKAEAAAAVAHAFMEDFAAEGAEFVQDAPAPSDAAPPVVSQPAPAPAPLFAGPVEVEPTMRTCEDFVICRSSEKGSLLGKWYVNGSTDECKVGDGDLPSGFDCSLSCDY